MMFERSNHSTKLPTIDSAVTIFIYLTQTQGLKQEKNKTIKTTQNKRDKYKTNILKKEKKLLPNIYYK